MTAEDAQTVIDMMRTFYASPAVLSNGSKEIFEADVAECVGDSPYAEGFVFEVEGSLIGYGMLAKSYSTEFGKRCIWIEDLYLLPEYRGLGIGSAFFAFIEERYPNCLLRLEVEEENERARHVYEKNGFDVLPYMEMKKYS
jgi:GNAT superfamily N-acetyltransferase